MKTKSNAVDTKATMTINDDAISDIALATAEAAVARVKEIDAAKGGKKLSPKHKDSRGVPHDYKSTWVPLDLPEADNAMVNHAAQVRGVKVAAMLAEMLHKAIEAQRDRLETDAAAYQPAGGSASKTVEKLATMSDEERATWMAKERARILGMLQKAGIPKDKAEGMVTGMVTAP